MLILLDIDGVMVQAKSWSSPPLREDGFYGFSTRAVDALNKIITAFDAKIVLTTSHKYKFSLEEWKLILKNRGIKLNSIDRLPANVGHLSRKDEILNWFSMNKNVEDFVIIDDDTSLNGLPKILIERLVQTKPLIGLNSSHVSLAIGILNTPLELA